VFAVDTRPERYIRQGSDLANPYCQYMLGLYLQGRLPFRELPPKKSESDDELDFDFVEDSLDFGSDYEAVKLFKLAAAQGLEVARAELKG